MKKEKTAKAPKSAATAASPRRKKPIVLVVLILLLLFVGTCLGFVLYKQSRAANYIASQNYVASKLIEMGSYEDGRVLAEQAEQKKRSDISEALIVLSAAFSADYDEALSLTELFMTGKDGKYLSDIHAAVTAAVSRMTPTEGSVGSFLGNTAYVLDEEARDALLAVLLRVQGDINVKKTSASLLAMQQMMTNGHPDESTRLALEEDDSLFAKKVQMLSAIRSNNYEGAYAAAEALFAADASFENRAALANLAATGYVSLDGEGGDTISAHQTKLDNLYTQYYQIQEQYYDTADEKALQTLSGQMKELEDEIAAVQAEIVREPVKRAINFIESTTPPRQRKTTMYTIELSQLYYRAGNEDKASALLMGVLSDFGASKTESAAIPDPIDRNLTALVENYRDAQGYGQSEDRRAIWQRTADMLGILDLTSGGYYGEISGTSYYDFVLSILSRIYRGLTIRSIDASDYPRVRVVVNVASDEDGSTSMKKNDFTVLDMRNPVSVRLVDAEDAEIKEAVSVMLVVDRSGSMSGMPMEDTKNAVMNFVRETAENVTLGVTVFEAWAEILAPLGSGRTELLRAVDSIQPGGGTDIQAGLRSAGEALSSVSGRRIIILLSDGADGNPGGIDAVLDELSAQNICVYSIGFGGADTDYLSYIADRTGGKFLSADSSALLSDIYTSIGEYMVNDYILEFEAKTDIENFVRELQIRADTSGAVTDSRYNVGVSLEEILAEAGLTPAFNSYRETGGSAYSGSPATPVPDDTVSN